MLAVLSPTKLTGDVQNIRRFAEVRRVDCMLNTFLFAREKLLNEQTLMKQNMKQNKVHDEQIIVAKVWKKSLSDKNQLPLWIKRTISLWTAMEINLAMFTVYKWQSIKLLWNKCKFWDFSILTMTSKKRRGMQCFLFGRYKK